MNDDIFLGLFIGFLLFSLFYFMFRCFRAERYIYYLEDKMETLVKELGLFVGVPGSRKNNSDKKEEK